MSKEEINKNNRKTLIHEVERLFHSGDLSQRKKDMIGRLVRVLGEYMLVDRDILNKRAEEMFGEKIGLSFIKKAIELELIIELQDSMFPMKNPDEISGNHFYYSLAAGGLNLLRLSKTSFRHFNILDSYEARLRVLQFNYMVMDKGMEWIFSKYSDLKNYLYFHCKESNGKDVIVYYSDQISQNEIILLLKAIHISQISSEQNEDDSVQTEYVSSKFNFIRIEMTDTTFTDNLVYIPDRWENEQKLLTKKRQDAFRKHYRYFSNKFDRNKHYNMYWDPGDLMTLEEKKYLQEYIKIQELKEINQQKK